MHDVKIKKGYRFRMAGAPSKELAELDDPHQIAFLPDKMPYIKPRLKIAEGDPVRIGSLLFEDKGNPRFRFLSPAGGRVRRVVFGPRRIVKAIVIDRDVHDEASIEFASIADEQVEAMDRSMLVNHILEGGLWWIFRQLPFRNLPDPEITPPAIIVGLSAKEPHQPSPDIFLKGNYKLLAYGVKVLEKLSQGRVMVFADGQAALDDQVKNILTHRVHGEYPSDDPAALIYHVKTSQEQNRAWFVSGQDLLMLARLLSQGRYPVQRIVSVAGSSAPAAQHYRTRLGVPLSHLVDSGSLDTDVRYIVGGLFRGYASDRNGFMGHLETALNMVPNGSEAEFMALFNPGLNRPTYSRNFLSRIHSRPLVYDCNQHGGERACIACMHCTDVCPVDIMPHMAYKAVLADEVEEYLEHGLLDCVECGLCSYVCPSKIELTRSFVDAKAAYAKEQAG